METANAESGKQETSVGPYSTTIVVNSHAENGGLSKVVEPRGTESSEVLLTPTEAAAAGDVVLTFEEQAPGKDLEIREPAELIDSKEMGNKGSVDITSVKLTSYGDKGLQTGAKKELDDVCPGTSHWTIKADGRVKLRMSDTGYGAVKPITMVTMMTETAQRSPNHIAMGVKRNGEWRKWTYSQYEREVRMAAKSLIRLGVEPHHGVGILGFNSPEWFITYMAGIYAGAMSTGIYATNSAEACEYVLSDCQANVIVVENHQQLVKILKVWHNLPHLKAIVQYTGEVAERRDNIYSWEEFMNLSTDVPDTALQERIAVQAPNTCCSLIYTSGTTGNPKAVMLSHDNLTWTVDMTIRRLKGVYGKEIYVSYLPLSHIAAQMLDLIIPLKNAYAVYFAQPDALKGTLVNTWKEIRPTGVLGVPRVWEKMAEKLQDIGRQTTGIKKSLATWAKGVGYKGVYAKMNGKSMPWGWTIANILLKKIHVALGLDRCTRFGSGAAPITKETLDYFASLNIPLLEVYGMSECSGPHSFCVSEEFRLTSVGREMFGVETKIDKPDADGNGELCYWGRHVFMGYLNKEEQTRETIQSDGWLHSGDIGKRDNAGYLYVTGRIKELIITAGGENIPPVPIEDNVKEALPCISNAMLIGDKRKFLSMLLTLKVEVNQDTMEPLDNLLPDAVNWCKSHGCNATTVSEALQDKKVLLGIQAGIDKANEKAVSRAAKVQKWSILPKDFSLPGGELGPTLKLRRPIVVKQYDKTISAFYEED